MRTLAIAAVLLARGCSFGGPSILPMQIEAVEVRVAESAPPLVTAHVRGIIPDACSALGTIRQQRDANAVTLTITISRTEATCIQRIELFERAVALEGPFPAGRYTLSVNGVVTEFTI